MASIWTLRSSVAKSRVVKGSHLFQSGHNQKSHFPIGNTLTMQNPSDLILDDQRVVVTYVCCFDGIFLPIFEAQNTKAIFQSHCYPLLGWIILT